VRKRYVSYVEDNTVAFTTRVVLVSGAAWKEVMFTAGTATLGEQRVVNENAGIYFKQNFSGSLPAKDAGYPQMLRAIVDEPVYCRMTMANGKVLVTGPVRLGYNLDAEGHHVEIRFEKDSVTGLLEEVSDDSGSGE
jgi:hypothetical protein